MEKVAEKVRSIIIALVPKVFIGDFPTLVSEGVSIRMEEGDEPVKHFVGSATKIYKPRVVLTARSANYTQAATWLEDVRHTLDGYVEGGNFGSLVDTSPRYNGSDDSKIHEIQETYKIIMRE